MKILSLLLSALQIACGANVLLVRVNVKKLAIIYSTGHVRDEVRVHGGGRGRGMVEKKL